MADGNTTARGRRARSTKPPTSHDPIDLAMEAEASREAPDGAAHRLLVRHETLVGWEIAERRVGLALKLLTGLAGLAVAVVVALMVWTASRAEGLVIKPFSVPPELAARGVTGEAVARQLLDKLGQINAVARTTERQRQVTADAGDNISIEIPQTGVSLSQLEQWLRERLGHQTRLTGEVMLDKAGGLTLTGRIGSQALPSQTAADQTLDPLLQRLAEAIYRENQPRGYLGYLRQQKRFDEALVLIKAKTIDPSPAERAVGFTMLGSILGTTQGDVAADAAYRRAIALNPSAPGPYNNLALSEYDRGHVETALRLWQRNRATLLAASDLDADSRESNAMLVEARINGYLGDYARQLEIARALRDRDVKGYSAGRTVSILSAISANINAHDLDAARGDFADFGPEQLEGGQVLAMNLAMAAEDWPEALKRADLAIAELNQRVDHGVTRMRVPCIKGIILARMQRFAEADSLLAPTPLDSQHCVRARAIAAAAVGRHGRADHWFAEAVRMAPSFPLARVDWGRARLARGDVDGAIIVFRQALTISPRNPDAMAYLGEALLAKGQAKGALDQFEAAGKLTPRWGRLHMKWGEALARMGKAEQARAKWQAAAAMDLTAAERVELASVSSARTN